MAATTVEFLEPQKGVGPHGVGKYNPTKSVINI